MITLRNINAGSLLLRSLYYGPNVISSSSGLMLSDFYPLSMTLLTQETTTSVTKTTSSFTFATTDNNFIIQEAQ